MRDVKGGVLGLEIWNGIILLLAVDQNWEFQIREGDQIRSVCELKFCIFSVLRIVLFNGLW
jgi:hypothetical protein